MDSYFNDKARPVFDYSKIRDKGEKLITSGGKAPGHEPLKNCHNLIVSFLDELLKDVNEVKLRSIHIHKIVCLLADSVLAGGIRRSATISLFSFNDTEMLKAKSGEWWIKNPEFARANNSAVAPYDEITEEQFYDFWQYVVNSKSGEPGIIWVKNKNMGFNPCFTRDTQILSEKGYIKIGENVGEINLVNKNNEIVKGKIWSNGFKDTIKLKLSNGKEIKCTENHQFLTIDDKSIEAKNLLGKSLQTLSKELVTVIDIIDNAGYEEVFDFSLKDNTHWGVIEGIIAHNCGEASLEPYSFCNLVELNAEKVNNQEDFNNLCYAGAFLNTIQASYTNFSYLRPIWQNQTEKDSLIGTSLTGIASGKLDNIDLSEGALIVKLINKQTAKKININKASRTTLVKPSGTASLVLGTSSGIHDYYSEYYIRRVRLNKNESLYKYIKKQYPDLVEDIKNDTNGAVISFPQKAPTGSSLVENNTALSMIDRCLKYNLEWIRAGHRVGDNYHNVSATIYVKENEWQEVGKKIWDNRYSYHGLSFFPVDDNIYEQAPYEKINKKQYDKLNNVIKDFNLSKLIENEDETHFLGEIACSGNVCEVI